MIVIIDNFDSFTFNIVDFYKKIGEEVSVFRNNAIDIKTIETLQPSLIVLSPGPKDPNAAGMTLEIIKYFAGKIPLFGVCLGCQSIAQVYGAKIIRAEKMYHGKISHITHEGRGILEGVHSPIEQMRYHSLIVDETTLPDCLEITARSESNEIMAIRHKQFPLEGVQFHPESVASIQGEVIMRNALSMKRDSKNNNSSDSADDTALDTALDIDPDIASDAIIQEKLQIIIERLLEKQNLTKQQTTEMMDWFSENKVSSEHIALILTALRMKGETAEEIAGIATSTRKHSVILPTNIKNNLVDIVGTGGDKSNTFNISTAAAIVAAGAGAKLAKHGSRATTSKCGSADVLEALGIDINKSPSEMADMLETAGMCFMFAPLYHPSMKFVAPVRKKLKIRTVFNILGPLVNPALVPNIVLGVYTESLMEIMANTLISLGIQRALVVHAPSGVDEIILEDITHIIEIREQKKHAYTFEPSEYIPNYHSFNKNHISQYIASGDAAYNAALIESIIYGSIVDQEQKNILEAVVALNAGAALFVSGVATNIKDGIALAYTSIHSGAAKTVLDIMREN